jgi:competence protein ComEC
VRFVPWPWGLGLGVLLGVGWVQHGGTSPAQLATLLVGCLLLTLPALRAPSGWRGALLLVLWVAPLAAFRGATELNRADPWAGRVGEVLTLRARIEGGVAWPIDPPGPGLLLRGRALEASREALIRGELFELQGRRNPGGFDARAHYQRRGITAGLRVQELLIAEPPGRRLAWRNALNAGVTHGLSPPAAALMQAITLGVRDDLGPLREAFSGSGLAHVLALSGLHVGLLAGSLTLLVGGVGRWRSPLVVAGLLLYVALVGDAPSVVRATTMISVALLSRAFGVGGAHPSNHLMLALALSLLAKPLWWGDLGFVLSYLSVMGILLAAAPLAALLRSAAAALRRALFSGAMARLPRPRHWSRRAGDALFGSLAISIGAQWATASVVASTFGAFPLIAPLANLMAVPLASALVPLGMLSALLGAVDLRLAALINLLTGLLAEALLSLAAAAARFPALPWGEVSALGHAAFAAASLAVLARLRGRLKSAPALWLLALALLLTLMVPPRWAPPDLLALDVGQGDSFVVRVNRHAAVLIDGGGTPFSDFDVGARVVVPALRALGVVTLPLVVATHADVDHIEGLVAVLQSFPVGVLMIGHPEPERPVFAALMAAAAARGVPVIEARRGQRFMLSDLTLEVVHPTAIPSGSTNDDSVGLLLRWQGDAVAVLLGDVTAAVESALPLPPTPLLVAPHHGSATSTSPALLRAVQPQVVWISVGENRYGHPAPGVLQRLAAAGAEVAMTRSTGALRLPLAPR